MSDQDPNPGVITTKRKPKHKKKPKQTAQDGEDFDDDRGLNLAIGRMNSQRLAEYITSRTQRLESQLSAVELDDLKIPGRALRSMYFRTGILVNTDYFCTQQLRFEIHLHGTNHAIQNICQIS
jgi:hypothetical protein